MKDIDRIEIFKRWFSTQGHWIYPTRGAALTTWATRGIDNLPDAPKAVGLYPEIQDWVQA